MKLFLDTANVKEIKEAKELGLIDGVTTNPTLISREGRDFMELLSDICKIVNGPVSAEVLSLGADDMVKEARKLVEISKHIVIKIPITYEGLKALSILNSEKIKTNVTLVFSPLQALLAAKGGATYVSPFVGRLDDISYVGMDVASQILSIFKNYSLETNVIVASIRNPIHVLEAALMGAHVATIPFNVIQQLINHPLTEKGINRFLEDWKNLKK